MVSDSEYSSGFEDEFEEDRTDNRDDEDNYEECYSTDEEALINASAPKTSWSAQEEGNVVSTQINQLILKGNVSPRFSDKYKDKRLLDTEDKRLLINDVRNLTVLIEPLVLSMYETHDKVINPSSLNKGISMAKKSLSVDRRK